METFVSKILYPPLLAILCVGLFALPVAILGIVLHRRKGRYVDEAREPFTDLPLRPPGETLRIRIDELSEEYDQSLTSAGLVAVSGGMLVFAAPTEQKLLYGLGAAIVCIPTYWKSSRAMLRIQKDLWAHRLGFKGERVVAEELNQLLSRGYMVFHDIPFDDFNIDHVVVGRCGVYAIETKTRRKRGDIAGTAKATVTFDGERLVFPRNQGESWLRQAKRSARSLAEWLSSATGEKVWVQAVLTIPGWWVEQTRQGPFEVEVFNPKRISGYLSDQPPRLDLDAMRRIAHQLTERCRMNPTAR